MEYYMPLLFVLFTALLVSTSQAFKLDVGGSDGWTLNPPEDYTHWAGRYRFQINDVIVFKYKKGSDSVLEVKKEDYEKCNKTNPIKKFEDGETEFTLDRSGPFYFISGKDQNCEKGQKLTLVVISPRKHTAPSVPTPTSPPKSSPSSKPNPPSPSVSPSPPAGGPTTSSPSPVSTPPAGGPMASSPSVSTPPAGGPTASSPSVSTPPASGPTASSPVGGPTASSPMGTPMAGGPPAPSPGSLTPEGSPTSQSPGSSISSDGPAAQGLGPSGNENAKAPAKGSGSYVGPPSFVVYSVTVVVGALLLSY